jgi:putative PEP-CTERM system integral membrane protein
MSTTSLHLTPAIRAPLTIEGVLGGLVFWSWNTILLALVGAGIAPLLAGSFLLDLERGLLPWDFALPLVTLVLIPAASCLAAWRLRRRPGALVALFYGLELPVFFTCLARLFLLRELTPPVWLLGGAALVGLSAFAFERFGRARRGPWAESALLAGSTAAALCGLGVGAILVLYTAPLGVLLVQVVASPDWLNAVWFLSREPWALLVAGLGVAVAVFSATLFVVLPVAAPALYLASFRRVLGAHVRARGVPLTASIVALVVAVTGGLLVELGQQDQQEVLAMLATEPRSETERRARLDAEERIRGALQNAYLARHRYVAARGSRSMLSDLWAEAFGGRASRWAAVASVHDAIASPFLYDGPSLDEQARAAHAYERFFDTPIQEGERDAILRALAATHDRAAVEAGLLDRDSDKVWLVRQDVTVAEHGDWAEVELHDQYANQTPEQLEILVHFALPESAVVTGLWMGESADRAAAHRFVVAPRGAARAVYRSEVERRVDPALLEQVGPLQYRLRVFPIPALEYQGPTPEVHVWLRYRALARDGRWPLPTLLEKRNVFWSQESSFGVAVRGAARQVAGAAPWSRTWVAASGEHAPRGHDVTLPRWRVRATPLDADWGTARIPVGRRMAVLVDRSRSMAARAGELAEALRWLRERVSPHDRVDLFLASAPSRGEPLVEADLRTFDPTTIVCYGGQSLGGMLGQLAEHARDRTYDAVLVLTDDGGADLERAQAASPLSLPGPPWLVHLGGAPPTEYDDAVLDALASGGVTTSLPDALVRIAMAEAVPDAEVVDGMLWRVEPTTLPAGGHDGFAALAARRAVGALARRSDLGEIATLDALHRLALRHEIVTPFSSFIVLVNAAQEEALRRRSAEADRFRRDRQDGTEPIGSPSGAVEVSGVPEPEEWLLIGLGGLLVMARLRGRLGALVPAL